MDIFINQRKFVMKTISHELIDDRLILCLAKKIFEIFANAPYNMYMVNDCDLRKIISPQEFFSTEDYVRYDRLMSHTPAGGNRFCENIDITFELLKEKIKRKNSMLSLLRCSETDEIYTALLTYESTVERVFKHLEEWENPFLFSGIHQPAIFRNYDRFIAEISQFLGFQVEDNTPVFVPSIMVSDPSIRNTFRISVAINNRMKNYHIPEKDILSIVECNTESLAYRLYNSLGTGVLNYPIDPLCKDNKLVVLENIQVMKERLFAHR